MTSRSVAAPSAGRRTRSISSPATESRAGRASASKRWRSGWPIPSSAGSRARPERSPLVPIEVPLQRLPHGADLPLPAYATADAAGLDLLAAVYEPMEFAPGARQLVPTGIAIALPPGYE